MNTTHIVAGLGFLGVVGVAALSQFGSTAEVIRDIETEEVIVEVAPEWASDEDAVKAAQDVIRRKELEAELSTLEAEFQADTEAYEARAAAYRARKVELQKEIGVY